MKHLITILLLMICAGISAQTGPIDTTFVVVARFQTFSTVNDSTFSGSAVVPSDQLGQNFNPTQVNVGDYAVDQLGRLFRISSISAATGANITFQCVEKQDNNIPPIGIGAIYRYNSQNLIPPVPSNNAGVSSQLLSRILIHNSERVKTLLAAVDGYNPNAPILRVPSPGDTVTGHDWFYFTAPTIALTLSPTTTVYEVGTSNSIDLRVVTTNSAGATLSNGTLTRTVPSSNTVSSFGSVAGDTVTISFTPQQGGSGDYNLTAYSFQATQDYSGAESGTATSNTRSISGVYPVFYGMASTDTTAVKADIYGLLTKSVTTEGDKTYSFTGSGLIYYAFPASWGDTNLSSITDPNGFDATASFTRTTATVTSTGLTNNYSAVNYIVYYLNTGATTTSSSNYTFNQ